MMKALLFALALLLLPLTAGAQVTFTDTVDQIGTTDGKCRDYCSALSAADVNDPNLFVIGFGSSVSSVSWTDHAFRVDTLGFYAKKAVDKICTTATAAPGEYIVSVEVAQTGVGRRGSRGGSYTAAAEVTIDGVRVLAGNALSVFTVWTPEQPVESVRICIASALATVKTGVRQSIVGDAGAWIQYAHFRVESGI